MRVLFVHNPGSGDDDHAREHLVELMTQAGHQVTYAHSSGHWQSLLRQDHEMIAVAGGDGTVSDVARATAHRGLPIAILPTGTANNIARWLGVAEMAHADLIGDWKHASQAPFDLGVASGPWGSSEFLESVGIGLLSGMMSEIDAGTSGYVNELDGRAARVDAALDVLADVLRRSHPIECEIQLDDQVIGGQYLLVEILNFGSAGPNLRLAPHADGADGRLDVVLVTADERQWFESQLAARRQDASHATALRVHHARNVRIRFERSVLHLDDALITPDGPSSWATADVSVQPGALTFLIPARAAAAATACQAAVWGGYSTHSGAPSPHDSPADRPDRRLDGRRVGDPAARDLLH
jgi:diacylglycerol kinase family enzyme